MNVAPSQTSLASRVQPIAAGAHVVAAAFLNGIPVLVLADGRLRFGDRDVVVSDDIQVAAVQADRLVVGGPDGISEYAADGSQRSHVPLNGVWLDALTLGPEGAIAYSQGKTVSVRTGKGDVRTFTAPSTSQGLCFLPKGFRLAVAHYNGVSLWFPNMKAEPDQLVWKGSHLDITVSPDGRFVVTSMQENQLHGWRLPDKAHMRMSGYPAKPRSTFWSHDGHWLATSGAEACIIWPFMSKDGPMGKAPRECGVRPSRVTRVAFHPAALVVAIGYEDGFILLCRLTDAAELLVRAPPADSEAITAFAWDETGKRLLFGAADGAAGLLSLP
jgi:WD40 repeat protein